MDARCSLGVFFFYDDVFYSVVLMHWRTRASLHSLLQNHPHLSANQSFNDSRPLFNVAAPKNHPKIKIPRDVVSTESRH